MRRIRPCLAYFVGKSSDCKASAGRLDKVALAQLARDNPATFEGRDVAPESSFGGPACHFAGIARGTTAKAGDCERRAAGINHGGRFIVWRVWPALSGR